jgi:hypothetical protein
MSHSRKTRLASIVAGKTLHFSALPPGSLFYAELTPGQTFQYEKSEEDDGTAILPSGKKVQIPDTTEVRV